jgi:type IV pilus assembly protein PilW
MKQLNRNKFKLRNSGMSLIEIMIAVLIGLIMSAALISLFDNFSNMNRTQNGLARLQENGRYAIMRMKKDIENVGYQPCATISMDSPQRIDRGFATRPMMGFSPQDNGLPATGIIDTQFFIQGHECDDVGDCTPSIGLSPGGDPYGLVPDAGTTADTRARKSDVLTVRYLAAEAVNVDDTDSESTDSNFTLAQDPTLPPLSLEDGDDLLVANCYNAMILNATVGSSNSVNVDISSVEIAGKDITPSVKWASKGSLSSVYNFTKDFLTVTYYLGLKDHPYIENGYISSLYRIENGNAAQELIEGVERFDLTYGVQYGDGRVAYLTADQVHNQEGGDCIVEPIVPASYGLPALVNGTGCLWRSVFSVKVNMLLNTVYNSSTSATETFIYSPDGATPQSPADIPSGIDAGKMYRKEFTETISLQSNNL